MFLGLGSFERLLADRSRITHSYLPKGIPALSPRKKMLLSATFLAIAASFDAIAILCYKEKCNGHLKRWPELLRPRVHVFDAALMDKKLLKYGFNLKRNRVHAFLVTMSHVHVANQLFANESVNTFLMLEEDYELIEPPLRRYGVEGESASNIGQFVTSGIQWNFLKLGYNPKIFAGNDYKHCQAACKCKAVSNGVCYLQPRLVANESCWVTSSVGYASHRRAWPLLRELGNCTMEIGAKNHDLGIDAWFSGTSRQCSNALPVHHLVPGILHQRVIPGSGKPDHTPAMKAFASKCVDFTGMKKSDIALIQED